MHVRLIVASFVSLLVANAVMVSAGGQDVPSCFNGEAPDESDVAVEDFYVHSGDTQLWIENNSIGGLQRSEGDCVGANNIVVHYRRDFLAAGAP